MKTIYTAAFPLAAALAAITGASLTEANAQQPERTLTFTVTESEARIIDAGLGELPTKTTFALAIKLHEQWTVQMQRAAADQQAAVEKQVRDRIAAEDKAKAGAAAKDEAPAAPPP